MSKWKGMLAGAVGGLAGAALMGPLHMAAARWTKPKQPNGADATEKVASALAAQVAGRSLNQNTKKAGGQLVHFAFGAGMGGLYGLLAETSSFVTTGAGALFGISVYLGAHALAVPALGLAPSPVRNEAAPEAVELASHLVYGVVSDSIRRSLLT